MCVLGRIKLVLAVGAIMLVTGPVPVLAQQPAQQAQPEPQCQTIGGTTYCKDGTQFDQTQAGQPSATAAADGKPTRTNIGPTGPTQYQVDNTRIFGVDSRVRRLGETNWFLGQQDAPSASSGRNCFQTTTTSYCD
jgi:hypothetical protein